MGVELLVQDGSFLYSAVNYNITASITDNNRADTTMAGVAARIPTPPPPEMGSPVAENWCYTQVSDPFQLSKQPQKTFGILVFLFRSRS